MTFTCFLVHHILHCRIVSYSINYECTWEPLTEDGIKFPKINKVVNFLRIIFGKRFVSPRFALSVGRRDNKIPIQEALGTNRAPDLSVIVLPFKIILHQFLNSRGWVESGA